MRQQEIKIAGTVDEANAAANVRRKAQTGRSVTRRASSGNISNPVSSLTDRRLQLLRHVMARQDRLTPHLLARCLGRDSVSVQQDVGVLEARGLLTRGEDGRLSVPYSEIVVPDGLTEAA
jgi:predicted transcriptional regulator